MSDLSLIPLTDAIRESKIPLRSLSIAGNRIENAGAISLFDSLCRNRSILVLDLRRECDFGEEAAMHAAIMLQENSTLQKLFIWGMQ
jgi:hypothetical protein